MEKKKKFIIDIIFYGLILLLIWFACKFVLPVLIPFIIAFCISCLIRIPVKKLYGASELRNKIISIVTCITFYVIVFSIVAVAGVKIYHTISDFLFSIPTIYKNDIVPALNMVLELVEKTLASMDVEIANEIDALFNTYLDNIGEYIKTFSVNAIKVISGSLSGIPGFLIKLIIMIISTFFCMIDYNKIMVFLISCVPKGKEDMVMNLARYFKNTILIYLKSYSLLFLLTYSELTIGFTILGIPYAPLIGLLVAVFDILPILGVGGILLPWAAILLVMKNIPMAIGMLVLYLVITFVRNTIEPKLVGGQIGLHPLATLIFMYLGLKFLGFLGMFLFPVTLAVFVSMKQGKEV
ncbi:MAG: sporulation integral membrane protein YtvI [Lachnospiraceae bacterium]|nr:sporulation integral membrane protein YtvI [Lachnospiraceae bacterium]